ncbi:MAG: hypothetical protein HUU20_00490 [Pirellulales bacterium]|nr:hypothetical protein [Pirellulales bacterium]
MCRDLEKAGIGFLRRDNRLVDVADLAGAQARLDAQPWAKWAEILQCLLQRACPALDRLPAWGGIPLHYWSADETEWATDVMFRSPESLAKLYPLWIRYGTSTFSSRDVMRFLGRTRIPRGKGVDVRFNGEVVSDLEYRPEGVRIKHRMNRNSIKMYDKQGSVLRVETTVNDARELAVYRASEADPQGKKKWRRLRKGMVDLPRRAEVSQAANNRYLTALSAVDSATPLGQVADTVHLPVFRNSRRVRGPHLRASPPSMPAVWTMYAYSVGVVFAPEVMGELLVGQSARHHYTVSSVMRRAGEEHLCELDVPSATYSNDRMRRAERFLASEVVHSRAAAYRRLTTTGPRCRIGAWKGGQTP